VAADAAFLQSLVEFPPRQKAASFTIDQAIAKLKLPSPLVNRTNSLTQMWAFLAQLASAQLASAQLASARSGTN
jgi:hypothetical protein